MYQMSVDVQERVSLARVDDVVVKDLVVQRTGGDGRSGHDGSDQSALELIVRDGRRRVYREMISPFSLMCYAMSRNEGVCIVTQSEE